MNFCLDGWLSFWRRKSDGQGFNLKEQVFETLSFIRCVVDGESNLRQSEASNPVAHTQGTVCMLLDYRNNRSEDGFCGERRFLPPGSPEQVGNERGTEGAKFTRVSYFWIPNESPVFSHQVESKDRTRAMNWLVLCQTVNASDRLPILVFDFGENLEGISRIKMRLWERLSHVKWSVENDWHNLGLRPYLARWNVRKEILSNETPSRSHVSKPGPSERMERKSSVPSSNLPKETKVL